MQDSGMVADVPGRQGGGTHEAIDSAAACGALVAAGGMCAGEFGDLTAEAHCEVESVRLG